MQGKSRRMLNSKIHGATVTHADLNYEGSISIPVDILQRADMLSAEAVWIWNVTNGNRFETYTIEAPNDSGVISVNGAAARLVQPGDKLIIASFCLFDEQSARKHTPTVVFLDQKNKIKELRSEIAGPALSRFNLI